MLQRQRGSQARYKGTSMFDLRIESAPDAIKLMHQGWPTHVLSLVGDDLRVELPCFGPHHFIARFHDVEAESEGFVAPSEKVLAAALEHAAGLGEDERLLIHCHAGKSRSPAMALGVMVGAGASPAEALEKVKSLRPFVIPNRLMVRILDGLLGQRGEVIRVVREHYASLPEQVSLPDRGGWNL
jgi:predicted protein tyrosine phosphatase